MFCVSYKVPILEMVYRVWKWQVVILRCCNDFYDIDKLHPPPHLTPLNM